MTDPIITLTTDFGEAAHYVPAMKGVILCINATVRIVDLSHRIPAQDIRHADYFLAGAIPHFPTGVIHVVVVDPGVGTERSLLYVEVGGHRLLLPDNGCWTTLAQKVGAAPSVRRLTEARFWRQPVSQTFHGRDILAPVAGHLSLGVQPDLLGPAATAWTRLEYQPPRGRDDRVEGEVVYVDDFGNLITNIPENLLLQPPHQVQVGGRIVKRFRWVRTYAEAQPGEMAVLVSSIGNIEVAVPQGSAAKRLKAAPGTKIVIRFPPQTRARGKAGKQRS